MDLYTSNRGVVLESWLLVEDSLLQYAKEVPDQARKLRDLWTEFLNHYTFTDELRRKYAQGLLSSVQKLDTIVENLPNKSKNADKVRKKKQKKCVNV